MARITEADAGTWLDGHWGWHNTYRVVEKAQAYGFKPTVADRKVIRAYEAEEASVVVAGRTLDRGDIGEWAMEVSNDATDFLQSKAPEGYYFEWDSGELSLIKEDDE